jgi:hypothetical protein
LSYVLSGVVENRDWSGGTMTDISRCASSWAMKVDLTTVPSSFVDCGVVIGGAGVSTSCI